MGKHKNNRLDGLIVYNNSIQAYSLEWVGRYLYYIRMSVTSYEPILPIQFGERIVAVRQSEISTTVTADHHRRKRFSLRSAYILLVQYEQPL